MITKVLGYSFSALILWILVVGGSQLLSIAGNPELAIRSIDRFYLVIGWIVMLIESCMFIVWLGKR